MIASYSDPFVFITWLSQLSCFFALLIEDFETDEFLVELINRLFYNTTIDRFYIVEWQQP